MARHMNEHGIIWFECSVSLRRRVGRLVKEAHRLTVICLSRCATNKKEDSLRDCALRVALDRDFLAYLEAPTRRNGKNVDNSPT